MANDAIYANSSGEALSFVPTPFSGGAGTDANGNYTEEQVIWGTPRTTPELHNVMCGGSAPGCKCIGDGKWCFRETSLSVATPNAQWVFVQDAPVQIRCTRDNQGSAGWNALGAPDRFFVDIRNPTEIRARALTGSRNIDITIGCLARYYP